MKSYLLPIDKSKWGLHRQFYFNPTQYINSSCAIVIYNEKFVVEEFA